jgi:hypothetical protein
MAGMMREWARFECRLSHPRTILLLTSVAWVSYLAPSASHHTGRAKLVFDAITANHSAQASYDTWYIQFKRSKRSPYYSYIEKLKSELPEHEKKDFEGRLGWSSPFIWFENPDGSRHALGGRDKFCEWAKVEFSSDANIVSLASTSADIRKDWKVDVSKPGTLVAADSDYPDLRHA